MEFAQSMLQSTKLSKSFWGQAIATTYYLQNWSYTSTFSGKTPYEYWKGKKPILHHFKVFKCIAYAHANVCDDTWRKLEPKSIRCVFFGYGKNTRMKGYKLYNMATQKSFYNQDVIFDEHSMVLLSKSTNVSTTFTFMSKLESNPMPLMDDQDHIFYYFEDSFPTSN